jgi:cytochrome c-type biogenesis protein CcmE
MAANLRSKLVLTAVAVMGLGFLVKSSIDHGQHMDNVDDLTAVGDFERWNGSELKVAGWVQAGSIVEKVVGQETYRTFLVRGMTGRTMRVFASGPKPDTFADNSEVVATGFIVPSVQLRMQAERLGVRVDASAYVVDASDLSAKCPSKYDGVRPSATSVVPFKANP